jgi:hypothetical protein
VCCLSSSSSWEPTVCHFRTFCMLAQPQCLRPPACPFIFPSSLCCISAKTTLSFNFYLPLLLSCCLYPSPLILHPLYSTLDLCTTTLPCLAKIPSQTPSPNSLPPTILPGRVRWRGEMKAYLRVKGPWLLVNGSETRPASNTDLQAKWDVKAVSCCWLSTQSILVDFSDMSLKSLKCVLEVT